MNKDRLLQVADAIEREEIAKFHMIDFVDDRPCGTVACVAGFTALMFIGKPDDKYLTLQRQDEIAIVLGLNASQAGELFFARSLDAFDEESEDTDGYEYIENEGYNRFGAEVIRWMVANDTINWRAALTAIGAIK